MMSASECGGLLERIAAGVGVDAWVELKECAGFVAEDLGLVISHHGQTIDAI